MITRKHALLKGDTVGIITPSSPMFEGRLEAGVKFIQDNGYIAKIGQYVNDRERFLAGADADRAKDIMDFIADDNVKIIMASGGGYGAQRLLPLLDLTRIKRHPKPIVGFSDTTALQVGLLKSTNLVSYTGFVFNCLNDGKLDPLVNETLLACLRGTSYKIQEGVCVNKGEARGQLIGGNLECITALMGTPFEPDFTDCILLLEDLGMEPFILDKHLSQLSLAGVFNRISGCIFGQFSNCVAKYYPERDGTSEQVINEWCAKINVPCIKDFPYGHVNRRCVLPIGASIDLNATKPCVSINYSSN